MVAFWSLVAGITLLLLLLAVITQGWLASRQNALSDGEQEPADPCPEEFVSRVFTRADWDFVRAMKSESIERLFEQERKKVALTWVRQISAMIRQVMREHAQAARRSHNLVYSTEVKILAQFLTVMAACGTLSVAIRVAGPLGLAGLAQFAQSAAQRARALQESFEAGVLAQAGTASSA
jgi:hypothetical protein